MSRQPADHSPLSEEQVRLHVLGDKLGPRALQIEPTGSTSVPDLAAKPVIDVLLVVKILRPL